MEHYETSVDEVNNAEESYHYPKDKMVYLSADAVYVIGGIVDRNRYKYLTLNKAKELGYRCAKWKKECRVRTRLPLELVRFHGSRVLTVNNGEGGEEA